MRAGICCRDHKQLADIFRPNQNKTSLDAAVAAAGECALGLVQLAPIVLLSASWGENGTYTHTRKILKGKVHSPAA